MISPLAKSVVFRGKNHFEDFYMTKQYLQRCKLFFVGFCGYIKIKLFPKNKHSFLVWFMTTSEKIYEPKHPSLFFYFYSHCSEACKSTIESGEIISQFLLLMIDFRKNVTSTLASIERLRSPLLKKKRKCASKNNYIIWFFHNFRTT